VFNSTGIARIALLTAVIGSVAVSYLLAAASLVNNVLNWARGRNARSLLLMVTSNNEPAIGFYQRLGFTRTGRTEPYPNDPVVIEYEMSRPIP
jgi:GNAT superfamily N-acetyltransferase